MEAEAELLSVYEKLRRATAHDDQMYEYLPKVKKSALLNPKIKRNLNHAVSTFQLIASLKLHLSNLETMLKEFMDSTSSSELDDVDVLALVHAELASLCMDLRSFLEEVQSEKARLEEKMRWTKKLKKLCKITINVAFSLALVITVVPAVPHIATVAVAAGCTAIKTVEAWVDSVWENRVRVLQEERELAAVMAKGVVVVHEMETVGAMVGRLKGTVEAMFDVANTRFEVVDAEAMAAVIEEMRRRVEEVGRLMKEVEKKVEGCHGEIANHVAHFFDRITE